VATLTELEVDVDVGETEVGEVYVGEINVGTVTREVDVDIDTETYYHACDTGEREELLGLAFAEDNVLHGWILKHDLNTLKILMKDIIAFLTKHDDYDFSNLLPEDMETPVKVQTEEEKEALRAATQEAFENIIEAPPLDLIRNIKLLDNIEASQLRAFPRDVIARLCDKLIGASDPLIVYQLPPDLKTMIEAMQPGEITEDFLQELRLQVG